MGNNWRDCTCEDVHRTWGFEFGHMMWSQLKCGTIKESGPTPVTPTKKLVVLDTSI